MHDYAIIEHLASMCGMPTDIRVLSTDEIQGGAIFAVFTFGADADEMTAIYYPGDDTLYTPTDWQGRRPKSVEEIGDYQWMSSAGDDAIVIGGLPRAFNAIRDEARKEYGRKVAAARETLGMTAAELAQRAGLARPHVSRIEAGRYNVTLDTMTRINAVLGI